MRVAVYTAIFGDKDELKEPLDYKPCEHVDYYLISDNKKIETKLYKLIVKDSKYDDVTKNARFYKVNGLEEFKEYDYVIWHDGNLQMKHLFINDLIKYVEYDFLASFKHPDRENFYQEAVACIDLNKDFSLKILWQSFIYYWKGLPSNLDSQLYETCILVKNMRLQNKIFYDTWWNQILTFSRRDQLALPYVLFILNTTISVIPGCRYENKFSEFSNHKNKFYGQKLNLERFNFKKIKILSIKLINYFESRR